MGSHPGALSERSIANHTVSRKTISGRISMKLGMVVVPMKGKSTNS